MKRGNLSDPQFGTSVITEKNKQIMKSQSGNYLASTFTST